MSYRQAWCTELVTSQTEIQEEILSRIISKKKTYSVSNAREQAQNILDLLSSENKSNPICY